jgi:hypothetical protein
LTLEELVQEMRLSNSILKAVHRESLKSLNAEVTSDPVQEVIVEFLRAEGSSSPGDVKAAVIKQIPDASTRTIERRIAALEDLGVLARKGAGRAVHYSLTGLLA